MSEFLQPLHDRHLEAATLISCKREPACFAFLCANAVASPLAIERLNFDVASADYHDSRATVWATLDMRAEGSESRVTSLLGFDENFLRPFTRAVLEAAATRIGHRMTIGKDDKRSTGPRVVDYIRSTGGIALRELIVTPYDQILSISTPTDDGSGEDTLFQLPRTDSFLKMLARITHLADVALRDMLHDMERLGRKPVAKLNLPEPKRL